MQQGGQYGDVPPQYARPSGGPSTAASGTPNSHAHLFNLSHDVAAAGGGLGLSSNSSSSLSHSGGPLHHAAAHSFSLHHHPLQGSVPAQPYHHFPDHLSSHHHHQQSIQSALSPRTNPQQPQLEHSAPTPSSSSSPAGLHNIHHQSQKHGMIPSVTINVHTAQDTPHLQQSSILQQQYAQQQQQHSLGLGLDSPKPSLSSLQQALASRSSVQQPQASSTITNMIPTTAASSTPTSNIMTSSPAVTPSSMAMQGAPAVAAALMINSSMAAAEPGVAMNLQQLTNNRRLQAGAMTDQAGLQDEGDGLADDGEKGGGGNRWPRQETLALLKVRSEMDASFRDSSLKRPLWDEVSRKLAEVGFQRSAKKCKEKFENVHKYYKRTKEGRAGRQDGKNYRFFSELEALYGNPVINPSRGDLGRPPTSFLLGSSFGAPSQTSDLSARPVNPASFNLGPLIADASGLNVSSDTSSSDDDNDDDYDTPPDAPPDSRKRKRKSVSRMMSFFESLLKQVIEKQEQMQQRFLDALERREQDRMIREEAWKRQEMARTSREHDLRSQERSLAATRDAAIVSFLQKVTGQAFHLPTTNALAIAAQPVQSHPPPMSLNPALDPLYHHIPEDQDPFDPTSKRWPKPEVLALIKLRTSLHSRFTEPGPKGPLWEDITNGMSRLGYNRNAKRCKEKWENINKYFKKAKESNKNRPENAKTCPYYHHLDALYKQGVLGSGNIGNNIKALTYKPSSDNLDGEHSPAQLGQVSARSGREGDLVAGHGAVDQVVAIMPPTSQMSTASDATASTGNGNVSANAGGVSTHLFSAAGNPHEGEDLFSKEMKPHPGSDISLVRPADVKSDVIKAVIENSAPRLELADDMSVRPSVQMQRGIDEPHLHAGNASNERYNEHKVDLEQEAGQLVNEAHEAGHQQKQHVLLQQQHAQQAAAQLQYQQMEGVASGLAQHSSFIANMLQKFSSSDPAESNTSTASTNQDQH